MRYDFNEREDQGVLRLSASSPAERKMLYDLYTKVRDHCGPECMLELAVIGEFSIGEAEFIEFAVRKRED